MAQMASLWPRHSGAFASLIRSRRSISRTREPRACFMPIVCCFAFRVRFDVDRAFALHRTVLFALDFHYAPRTRHTTTSDQSE